MRCGPDFDMSCDGYRTHQYQDCLFAVCTFRFSEPPRLTLDPLKIAICYPVGGLIGVTALCPFPEHVPDLRIQSGEDRFSDPVPVVHGPTLENRVEYLNELGLSCMRHFFQGLFHLVPQALLAFQGRFDQQFLVVLAYIDPKEIETVLDVRDLGFLQGEFQTAFSQKRLNGGQYLRFQCFFRCAADDEVVRIADDMEFAPSLSLGTVFDDLFQSIQGHVREYRRDNTSLRSSRPSVVIGVVFDVSRFEPLVQWTLFHRDVFSEPLVIEVVETTANVAFEYPLGCCSGR